MCHKSLGSQLRWKAGCCVARYRVLVSQALHAPPLDGLLDRSLGRRERGGCRGGLVSRRVILWGGCGSPLREVGG